VISKEQLERAEIEFTTAARTAFRDAKSAESALESYTYYPSSIPYDPAKRDRLLSEYREADYMAESRAAIATLLREQINNPPRNPAIAKVEESRDILRAYLRGNESASIERALDLLEQSL
jgi:hypothetical protein